MSPKDAALGGNLPSSMLVDAITKLCSSMRAYSCLQRMKQAADEKQVDMDIKLILNPWNESMDPQTEFRVFVPSPAAGRVRHPTANDFRISSISQYAWQRPFKAPFNLDVKEVKDKVYIGSLYVLMTLVAHIAMQLDTKIKNALVDCGFTFDVLLKEDSGVQLVEIKPLGAMSSCGACLIYWILDVKVLYDLDPTQFAVTVEGEP
ncbi:hypothetical protein EK21DRAFT_107110 [Setomelanomma holmii]|uniref:Uncharacterized protein n=1 Tax=Setomelanomma holmii TaxID=210430 RepID=A0A9P4HL81_9PLEO|nr:hypothetical protein EK21DRAFT_107110 [Setomelanomma holmii]